MKKFTQVKKTINGTEYTAQFNGFGESYKYVDEITDEKMKPSFYKGAEYLLKNVLVEPKKSFDDFESREELDEVIAFLTDVKDGTFRETTDEGRTKADSKK